jgi:hypothetical protein
VEKISGEATDAVELTPIDLPGRVYNREGLGF